MRRLTANALPGIMLVLVIIWALFAVIMLTGIIATANRIESRVGVINEAVTPINRKLDVVPVLAQVQDTAGQIRDAATPLTGIIGNVVNSASSIDLTVKQILSSAESINRSADSINQSVLQINPAVVSIESTLNSIEASATSINASARQIGTNFIEIVDLGYDIKTRVTIASAQADDIIRETQGIESELDDTLAEVVRIENNATGIASSPLIMNAGNAGAMREMALAASGARGPTTQAGLPAFDLLPAVPVLGIPALPLPPVGELTAELNKTLLGLPVLSDVGNVLGSVGTAPK
jgi:methyl-accepting chemotaxis protein